MVALEERRLELELGGVDEVGVGEEGVQRLPGHDLDQPAEHVGGTAVLPARAGLVQQRQALEQARIPNDDNDHGFRMPVQWVCRPDQDFRGFAGSVVSGTAGLIGLIPGMPLLPFAALALGLLLYGDSVAAPLFQLLIQLLAWVVLPIMPPLR